MPASCRAVNVASGRVVTVQAGSFWAQHGAHTLLVAVPALGFALLGLGADLRSWWHRGRPGRVVRTQPLMLRAAALSAAAGLIHAGVAPHHFAAGTVYGAFFVVSAIFQFAWSGIVVARDAQWTAPIGLLGNASIVLLWVVTRTLGIPLGPETGLVEPVGVLDLLCGACEIGVVVLCALAIRQHVHPWRTPRRGGYVTPSSTV